MSAINELIQCPICLENYDIHNRIPMMLSACKLKFIIFLN